MICKDLFFPKDNVLSLPNLSAPYIDYKFYNINSSDVRKLQETLSPLQNNASQPLSETPLSAVNILSAKVISVGENVKTRIEIFIDVMNLGYEFLPGDCIGILPENQNNEVDHLLKLINLEKVADDPLEIYLKDDNGKKKVPQYVPRLTTARKLFSSCLDLRSVLKKGFIRALVECTQDTKEKRRLEEFCCREGSSEYNDHILNKSICILDILQAFPTCKPTIGVLIENLPRLTPRPYSIASSPLEHPNSIRIIFNLVQDSRGRNGVCTSWLYERANYIIDWTTKLNRLSLNDVETDKISIFLRKRSKFRIPETINSSLIMIGTGTGVSPFIGFLEHRNKQLDNNPINSDYSNVLLFGCRYKNKDFIYREELEHYLNNGVLDKLLVCYSRDDSSQDFKYVQDLFKKDKECLVNLLTNKETYLFICGDARNMVRDVQEVIIQSFISVQGISKDDAIIFIQNLEKEGRFVKDVWL